MYQKIDNERPKLFNCWVLQSIQINSDEKILGVYFISIYQPPAACLALNSTTEIMLLPTYMPKKLYLIRVRLDRPNTYETLDTNQDFFETSASNGKLKPNVLNSDYHIDSDLTILSILSRFEANLRKNILHGI